MFYLIVTKHDTSGFSFSNNLILSVQYVCTSCRMIVWVVVEEGNLAMYQVFGGNTPCLTWGSNPGRSDG